MVNYTCEKCNKEFIKKCHYLVHMNKKKPCEQIIIPTTIPPTTPKIPPIIDNLDNFNNTCLYCNTIFTRRDALKRHIEERHDEKIRHTYTIQRLNTYLAP